MRSVQSTLFALLAASGAAVADTTLNLTRGVSPISRDVYDLHMCVFWICVAIGIVVFGAMFYSMYYHRKSRGAKAAEFHEHTGLEVTWSIIPVLILVIMAIPATKVLLNINNTDKEEVTIKVTGYQWKWRYEYMEDGISFFSNLSTPQEQMHNQVPKGEHYLREVDHPLVLPIHKKIRFVITSNDVNHAWWVPDFAVKRDAISGFINEAWTRIDKPGTYYGQCAELCGVNHAFMPIVVIAMSEQGYKDWVAQQKGGGAQAAADLARTWTMAELMDKGKEVYNRICAACHQPNGEGMPPTFPAMKGSKIATGPVEAHIERVLDGKAGTAMQAFKGQLSEVELASVITYERNAFGNNTNSMVQPYQIKAIKDGKTISEGLQAKPGPAPAGAKDDKAAPAATGSAPATAAPVAAGAPAAAAAPAATDANLSPADQLKAAIARGEKVYSGTCAVCHQPGGTGMPPTFPALKGSKIVTGPVAAHINQVLNGKPGTAMQAFRDQMNDQDIADVITYERNSWGNNDGKLVKPEDVKADRSITQPNK